jgi:hypothetical protein
LPVRGDCTNLAGALEGGGLGSFPMGIAAKGVRTGAADSPMRWSAFWAKPVSLFVNLNGRDAVSTLAESRLESRFESRWAFHRKIGQQILIFNFVKFLWAFEQAPS